MCSFSPFYEPVRAGFRLLSTTLALLAVSFFSPGLRAEGDLQGLLDEAVRQGAKQITIPPGSYRLAEGLRVEGLKDVAIDGTGVTLVMTKPKEVLLIKKCENLSLKGLTIDYDPLPFTQGTVTGLSNGNTVVEFEVHEGYPAIQADMLPGASARHFFDAKTRYWKEGSNDFAVPKLEVLEGRKARAIFLREQKAVQVGDYICFDRRMLGQGSGVAIQACSGTNVLENITMHASPALAFVGRLNEGKVVFRGVKIERGPRPPGATEDRLISTNADGVNFAFCRMGPTIENCDFGFMADDGVNLHGVCVPVMRVVSPTEILVGKPGGPHTWVQPVKAGDAVQMLANGTFEPVGQATLQGVEVLSGPEDVKEEEIAKCFDDYKKGPFTLYRVKLAQGADFLKAGKWLTVPAIACNDFLIRNSSFHDNRGRALRIMASNGRIEGNTIERIGTTAIQVGPEFRHWREPGWVKNVVIAGNTIRNVGSSLNMTGNECYTPGAISVCAAADRKSPPYWQGNEDITIEENTIEGCPVSGIHAYAVTRLVIRGNTIKRVNLMSGITPGLNYLLTAQHAIELNGVADPVVQDNTISERTGL
ncbi:right-handed parallel beta-helix repeat-containing protein [soil metagenome]